MDSNAHTYIQSQEDYPSDTSSDGSSIECKFDDYCQRMKHLGIYRTVQPSHLKPSPASYNHQRSPRDAHPQRPQFTSRKFLWHEFLTLYLCIKEKVRLSSLTPPSSRPSSSSSSSVTLGCQGGMSVASTNASLPWSNPHVPQQNIGNRVPADQAYPSLRTQNLVLSRMQTILEYACFRFAEKHMPDILQITGWTCAEAGELSVWVHHFHEKSRLRQLEEMSRRQGSQISPAVLLNSVKEIRHDAVHRNPLNAWYLSFQMSSAVTFCQFLGVSDALNKLQSIQLCTETQVRKLGIITGGNIKLGGVSQPIEETPETFEERRKASCKILQKMILDPGLIDFDPEEEEEEAPIATSFFNFN
ncbi:hypothetical protein ACHAQD_003563 [Fusarium lateritium]